MRKKLLFATMLLSASFALAANDSAVVSITVNNNLLDWCNLQWPGSGSIQVGSGFTVYAQVYEPGVTDTPNHQGAGISAWIGYSAVNTNPSGTGWTWVTATYNSDNSNASNDEYMANIGSLIETPGTYYYASRFTLDSETYQYGGFSESGGVSQGSFWDGVTYISGQLSVLANDPPVLAAIRPQVLTEDTPAFLIISASDPNNDPVTFSVEGGGAATVLATVAHDTLFLTPAENYFTTDSLSFLVIADDGRGGRDSTAFKVFVTPVNDIPVIAAIGNQSIDEGANLSFNLTATDVDGDALSWSVIGLPAGSSFTDNGNNTAMFSWTPGYTQAGVYTITFIVSDGVGGTRRLTVQTNQPRNRNGR